MTTMRILKVLKTIGVVAGGCLGIAILSGAAFERVSRERVSKQFAPAGRLIDIGGRRIQIDCRGTGSPTVVFESGLDIYGSLAWTTVHDSIAKTTRACAYSRAGIMWSDPARSFDVDRMASDLHAALAKSGESAPWVRVGHSLGGSYIATFASRYPTEVAGLVMVDASHPDH
jgi:pimeloyl-ACP methyl ester carboxylesterase